MGKELNIFIAGAGSIGTELAGIILQGNENYKLNLIGVSNSRAAVFNRKGLKKDWKAKLLKSDKNFPETLNEISASDIKNVIIVDTSSGNGISSGYQEIVEKSFSIVSANKLFNSSPWSDYMNLRQKLDRYNSFFLYETNVGAALPVIESINRLIRSGEKIYRIRGVFSGSLNYIFDKYSDIDEDFSTILKEAADRGYTETDPREDLSGMDVARKLLILAREAAVNCNISDVSVESLVPLEINSPIKCGGTPEQQEIMNKKFREIKKSLKKDTVLRYIGEMNEKGELRTSLVTVSADSATGSLKSTDNLFEIYSDTYRESPLIIKGPGAGINVTARGVFTDIIRAGESIIQQQKEVSWYSRKH